MGIEEGIKHPSTNKCWRGCQRGSGVAAALLQGDSKKTMENLRPFHWELGAVDKTPVPGGKEFKGL